MGIEKDDSAVAVEALLEIVHRFFCNTLGQTAGSDAIGGPLGKYQLHNGLAPTGGGGGSALIIGVAAATDERRVTESSGSFVKRAAGGRGSGDVAVAIEGDGSNGIVGKHVVGGCEEIVAIGITVAIS